MALGDSALLSAVALEWLAAFGDVDGVASSVRFEPGTLKQVLDEALGLGAAVGRLDGAMRVVAGIEARLAALASALEIDRRTGLVADKPAPRIVMVSSIEDDAVVLAGGWVPGLVAAAGAHAAGAEEGDRDARFRASDLAGLGPHALIVALAGRSLSDATARVGTLLDSDESRGLRGVPVHLLDGQRYVVPGPNLARSAELVAFAVHGERAGVTAEQGEMTTWNAGRLA